MQAQRNSVQTVKVSIQYHSRYLKSDELQHDGRNPSDKNVTPLELSQILKPPQCLGEGTQVLQLK